MKKFSFSDEKDLEVLINELIYEDLEIRDSGGNTVLHKAIELGAVSLVQMALDAGIDVNLKNNAGDTGAHIAATSDNVEVLQLLLDYGIDLDIRNNKQRTFEDIARINRCKGIEKLVRNYSEDIGYTIKINSHKKWNDEY